MDIGIGWDVIDREILAIVRKQRNENDYGKGKEDDTQDVISTVTFSLIRSCFSSHARRIMELERMTIRNECHFGTVRIALSLVS